MSVKLIRYDAACRAIAAAKRIDEVKRIRDVSIAMRAYAKQADNHDLEADAIEIRMRATRRMDQMRQEQKATVGLNRGVRRVGKKPTRDTRPTLAEAGINKNLANEGRKLGVLSERDFERAVKTARDSIGRVVKDALRADDKKERRALRERELGEKQQTLPDAKFGVIVADPEWRWEPWSRETGMDRAADNHYPTSVLDVIKARPVDQIAATDCVLFLWATNPMLPHALTVMAAWGFDYVSNYCWGKDKIGSGYWSREKHELLLIGTRGKPVCPAQGDQWDSLQMAPRGKHSEKPELFLEMIEEYFPTLPKIELNRRGAARAGWDAWGNEVQEAAE